jgi:hypothetical protein
MERRGSFEGAGFSAACLFLLISDCGRRLVVVAVRPMHSKPWTLTAIPLSLPLSLPLVTLLLSLPLPSLGPCLLPACLHVCECSGVYSGAAEVMCASGGVCSPS